MTEHEITRLLEAYKSGDLSLEQAEKELKELPYQDMGFAMVDHHREMRQGFPEVIYAEGKTKEQVRDIMLALMKKSDGNIMATRADEEKYNFLKDDIPVAKYDKAGRIIYVQRNFDESDSKHEILVLTAGTSDIPVAREAEITAKLMGNRVKSGYDAGVAGIHRLLAHSKDIENANVIIVIAGMEGALASVVGGLTSKPVIAVPTSVGYGASFQGLSALLAMLNSCASGVAVMNIDNGFGAGVLASKINHMR